MNRILHHCGRSHSLLPLLALTLPLLLTTAASGQQTHWVTAYYGGWELGTGSNGYLPVARVDFSAVTHVIHFAVVPRQDGTLDTSSNAITAAGSRALLKAAHAAGARVLISVGGWNSGTAFAGASNPRNLMSFVMTLAQFMTATGYDGIDVDWEPLNPQDQQEFVRLIGTLRYAIGSRYLLTAAAMQGSGSLMASVQKDLDQINIMTYDLSFPSPGWITWYNAPLRQNGVTFKSTHGPVPACDNIVASFVAAGVAKEKIGIGVEFGGSVWKGGTTSDGNGVTGPQQSWVAVPSFAADVPYYVIMRTYFTPGRYHWDEGTGASYLSIDSAGSAGDCFVSYEDAKDIAAKAEFVRRQGLGGLFVYELGMGYMGNGSNPLLEAVKSTALAGPPRGPLGHATLSSKQR